MREYLILMIIASVGFSGLLAIYQDLSANSHHHNFSFEALEIRSTSSKAVSRSGAIKVMTSLEVSPGNTWSEIKFWVGNSQNNSRFELDLGNGQKTFLSDTASVTMTYEMPGRYQARLFFGDNLVDEKTIKLTNQQQIAVLVDVPYVDDQVTDD